MTLEDALRIARERGLSLRDIGEADPEYLVAGRDNHLLAFARQVEAEALEKVWMMLHNRAANTADGSAHRELVNAADAIRALPGATKESP